MAIEEELVAGESPDKSVDEGTSGEARSSAERDPRLSVFRPRDPEPSAERDPLRAAVAAWVAGAGASGGTGEESEAEATEPPADAESPKPSADAESPKTPAGGESAKPSAGGESPKAPAGGEGSGSDAREGSDSEEGGAPVVSDASEVAGASGAREAAGASEAAGGSGASEVAGASGGSPASGASGDSRRSGVSESAEADGGSRTTGAAEASESASAEASRASGDSRRSGASEVSDGAGASGSASGSSGGAGAEAGSGSGSGSAVEAGRAKPAGAAADGVAGAAKPEVAEPADSERTAVFRAPKPEAPAADDSERTAVFRAPKPETKPDAPADSERTAVFRAVKPESKPEPSADEPADSERTAVFRAPKPKPKDEPGAPTGAGKAADSERTAVFRAVKPGSASASPEAKEAASEESADSERTAVFRAVKPGSAPTADRPAASRPVQPKADGEERASTFVPLRKDGEGPAKPAAATAAPTPAPPAAPAPAPSVQAAPKATAPALDRTERTRQQPLPPMPPLDLLADLTNNPPPPPSPLRTVIRRFKIYAPLVVLLAIIIAVVQLVRPLPEPKLKMTAQSSYTFDGGNPSLPWPKEGQGHMAAAGLGTVGTFGEQKPIAIGSVAKTMTAYVILKNHPLKKGEKGPMIDIDKTAVDDGKKDSDGESTVNTLKEGDKISEYDALAAIMIPSANNVARLLARWDTGGDQEAFVKKMNEAAKDLGMANTTYTDPSGLDATTVSTAEDQVKLGLKVVEMPELMAITKLPSWTDPSGKPWRNWNDLVPYNGAIGIKTGSTTKAGGNLLFAAEKKVGKTNQLIVGAVLGQHGVPILGTAITASKNVMLATQKMLVSAPVLKKGDVVGYVDDGLGGHTPVVATADVEAVGWPSLHIDVKLVGGDGKLPQTAKAGTEIGMLTVGDGASQVKVPVALQSDLAAPGIGSKLTRVG
ncbi:hypothetical protein ABZ128_29625 [Streptomyces sp. NPDC006326]|uniref:hypothetical protein n=1 Tax=Streptomyces sp. NPDC006326 TaxID=3156752 RepID=UPI0033B7AD51